MTARPHPLTRERKENYKMIVVWDKPHILVMSYREGVNLQSFHFSPGNNEVPAEVWMKIVEFNKKRMPCYADTLRPLGVGADEPPLMDDTPMITDAAAADAVYPIAYSTKELKDYIANEADEAKLKDLLTREKKGKNRPSITAAINKQLAAITETMKALRS